MVFKTIENLGKFFGKSKIEYENEFARKAYSEMLDNLNSWCDNVYKGMMSGDNRLESMAMVLNLFVKRQELKLMLVRHCLELDLIINNMKKPVVMVDSEGNVDA